MGLLDISCHVSLLTSSVICIHVVCHSICFPAINFPAPLGASFVFSLLELILLCKKSFLSKVLAKSIFLSMSLSIILIVLHKTLDLFLLHLFYCMYLYPCKGRELWITDPGFDSKRQPSYIACHLILFHCRIITTDRWERKNNPIQHEKQK